MTWIGSPPAIWAASSSTVIPGTVSAAEPPRGDAAEPLLDRGRDGVRDLRARARAGEEDAAVTAQAAEVQLVKGDGTHRLELLSLQCADVIGGRRREIERRESIANRVECSDGGPVGVLVVADDEIVGQPIERPGQGIGMTCWFMAVLLG